MPTVVTKTIKPQGGGDYSTLSAFAAGEQRDLRILDQIARAECYAGVDTAPVMFAGWSSNAACHIIIEPAEGHGHEGVWTTRGYRLETGGAALTAMHVGIGAVVYLRQLQIKTSRSAATALRYDGFMGGEIDRVLVDGGDFSSTTGIACAIEQASNTAKIHNCVVYGAETGIRVNGYTYDTGAQLVNNTVVRSLMGSQTNGVGIDLYGAVDYPLGAHLHNNLVAGYTTGYRRRTSDVTYTSISANVSTGGGSPNGASWNNRVVTFVNLAGGDLALATNDTGARDQGTDQSALIGTESINGLERPQGAAWDCGAFEVVSASVYAGKLTALAARASARLRGSYTQVAYVGALLARAGAAGAQVRGGIEAPRWDGALDARAREASASLAALFIETREGGSLLARASPASATLRGAHLAPVWVGVLEARGRAGRATLTARFLTHFGGQLAALSGPALARIVSDYAGPRAWTPCGTRPASTWTVERQVQRPLPRTGRAPHG